MKNPVNYCTFEFKLVYLFCSVHFISLKTLNKFCIFILLCVCVNQGEHIGLPSYGCILVCTLILSVSISIFKDNGFKRCFKEKGWLIFNAYGCECVELNLF